MADAIVRHRAWIAAFWAVAVVGLAPAAREISAALDVAGYRTGSSQAGEGERRLAQDFGTRADLAGWGNHER